MTKLANIEKGSYKIEINILKKTYYTCDKVITVKGERGVINYTFHNQPIYSAQNSIFGYNLKFIKNKIESLIEGVTTGYVLELNLNGLGFKSFKINNWYCLDLGFSNLVKYKLNTKIQQKNMKNKIILYSTDRDYLKLVGLNLRNFAFPNPYKGKGILLKNEVLKLKKKSKT